MIFKKISFSLFITWISPKFGWWNAKWDVPDGLGDVFGCFKYHLFTNRSKTFFELNLVLSQMFVEIRKTVCVHVRSPKFRQTWLFLCKTVSIVCLRQWAISFEEILPLCKHFCWIITYKHFVKRDELIYWIHFNVLLIFAYLFTLLSVSKMKAMDLSIFTCLLMDNATARTASDILHGILQCWSI